MKHLWRYIFSGLLVIQIFLAAQFLNDPLNDGRYYRNWSNGFWMQRAEMLQHTPAANTFFGVVLTEQPLTWYTNHPQFMALPLRAWTALFGLHEWTVRTLSMFIILLGEITLWFALRLRMSERFATLVIALYGFSWLMMQYMDKLDQEQLVMLGVALLLLGHEFFVARKKVAPYVAAAGAAVALWADWSGWVIVPLILLAAVYAREKKFSVAAAVGAAAGALIVAAQLMLETHGARAAIAALNGIYQYRAHGESASIGFWLGKQARYFFENYSWVIGALGLGVIFTRAWRTRRAQPLSWEILLAAIALGNVVYALIVRQASNQMGYYQFFYGLPVAFGMVWFAEKMFEKNAHTAAAIIFLIAVLTAYVGQKDLRAVIDASFGTRADMALLQTVRALPPDANIAALERPHMQEWFDNPNITYYAGRPIPITPVEKILASDFIFVQQGEVEKVIPLIEDAARAAHITGEYEAVCADLLCKLTKKK